MLVSLYAQKGVSDTKEILCQSPCWWNTAVKVSETSIILSLPQTPITTRSSLRFLCFLICDLNFCGRQLELCVGNHADTQTLKTVRLASRKASSFSSSRLDSMSWPLLSYALKMQPWPQNMSSNSQIYFESCTLCRRSRGYYKLRRRFEWRREKLRRSRPVG